MKEKREEDAFKAQVENRLDDLFREDSPAETEEHAGFGDDPLKGLKTVLLSIDWEISDSTLDALFREITNIESLYREDKVLMTFLQLLGSIGRYVKANKGKAHPEATRTLNSVYEALEKVALTQGMSQADKEKTLLEEVGRFKQLKELVARRKAERREAPVAETGAWTPPSPVHGESPVPERLPRQMTPQEAFAYAVEEIKEVIRAEFRTLRAEIKLWRESR